MRSHLVDTPMVFALRLDAAIFARNLILYDGISGEKRKFPAQKSLPSAFSCEGLSQICNLRQPLSFYISFSFTTKQRSMP